MTVHDKTTQPMGSRAAKAHNLAPYLFIGAAALYVLAFAGLPLLEGVWLSFTDTQLLNPSGGEFVGMQNYAALFSDPEFSHSFLVTICYTVVTVAGSMLLGTVAAVALNEKFYGRAAVRAVLIFPWAVPAVAAALIFTWIFNKDSGVVNLGLTEAGVIGPGWLVDPSWAFLAVTVVSIWKIFPFVLLVVLAALQAVPEELREAAVIDGADALNRFKNVVVPFLLPTMRVTALLMTIWAFRRFEIIWLLTQGGPVDSTNTLVINVYRQAFVNFELGRGAAMGVVGLFLSTAVTVVFFYVDRSARRREAI